MAIKALIFDFDGLILDTETPEIKVWQTIYTEHGLVYPVEIAALLIGGYEATDFDPAAELQRRAAVPVLLDAIRERQRRESDALILSYPAMAGVGEVLGAARQLGLRCAIASSSDRKWVETHLTRLGLIANFERIVTGDDVPKGRTKPKPDIYLKALDGLGLPPSEALVMEDSPNGIRAAHAAGLRVVGVPNPVTAPLGLEADLVLESLAAMPLEEMIRRIGGAEEHTQGPNSSRASAPATT